jgi:spore coat protein H
MPRRLARDLADFGFLLLVALLLGCGGDGARIVLRGPAGGAGESAAGEPASGGTSAADGGDAGRGTSGSGGGASLPLEAGGAGATRAAESAPGGVLSGDPGPSGAAATMPDDEVFAWVFDEGAVHSYELTLDPAVWAALQLNARDEQYVEADFRANGQALGRIGLRFKGSLGTLASCFAEDGTPRCSKMSMKLKFDEFLPEQRFAGLKRLNFNSMLFDDSLMHERLAYRVFREMGIAAPRSVHARLVINGDDYGLFHLVEDVDGRFTKRHFDGGDGNLYKEAWPGNADAVVLTEALETNESLADHSGFLQFQSDLLGAAPAELPALLERYVDVDQLLAYLAVDQTLVNWDGVAAFYCYDGFCENHNYFWYQDETQARFALIPWDLDNTFEPSPLAGVPGLFEMPADCSALYVAMGRTLSAPGCDRFLQGLVLAGGSRYLSQLDRLLEGPFSPGTVEGWVDVLETQLLPEVVSDPTGPDAATFEAEVARLRSAIGSLREQAELSRGTHL